MAVLVTNVFVSNHLDYYNSLFRELPSFSLHKLQCPQNTLECIVKNRRMYTQVTPNHHWLPVEYCCLFWTTINFLYSDPQPSMSLSSYLFGTRSGHPHRRYMAGSPFQSDQYIYLFIWGFTSLSTLYRSYHDG